LRPTGGAAEPDRQIELQRFAKLYGVEVTDFLTIQQAVIRRNGCLDFALLALEGREACHALRTASTPNTKTTTKTTG